MPLGAATPITCTFEHKASLHWHQRELLYRKLAHLNSNVQADRGAPPTAREPLPCRQEKVALSSPNSPSGRMT